MTIRIIWLPVLLLCVGCSKHDRPVTAPTPIIVPPPVTARPVVPAIRWSVAIDLSGPLLTIVPDVPVTQIEVQEQDTNTPHWRTLAVVSAAVDLAARFERHYRVRGLAGAWSAFSEFQTGPANPNASGEVVVVPLPEPPCTDPRATRPNCDW